MKGAVRVLGRVLGGALGLVTGSRQGAILLALAIAGGALYAWGASASREADRLTSWAASTCQAVGQDFEGIAPTSPCRKRIAALVKFQLETSNATATVLANAQARQQAKAAADLDLATDQAAARQAAATEMETANNEVAQDTAGPDWFRALNGLIGL